MAGAQCELPGSGREVGHHGIAIDIAGRIREQEQDRQPLFVGDRRRHVLDGATEQLERLAMGRHVHRLLRGFEGRAVCLVRHARPLVMHRRVGVRGSLEQAAELRRPGVEPPPLAGRHRSIERVPQQLVTEVVLAAAMDGVQHVMVDEFLDRLVERIDRQVHDPGENARDERPADDGARPRHRLGLGRDSDDPRQRRILEGLRHVGVQDGPAVREPIPADRAAQLLDMERDAVGPGVHRVDHVARRGQAGPEDQGRHQRRLVAGKATQADLLGEPLRDESRAPLTKHDPSDGLVAPVGPHEQQRPVTRLARQLGQGLQAEVVGPLEVLERQHRGSIRREQIDDLHDEVAPTGA